MLIEIIYTLQGNEIFYCIAADSINHYFDGKWTHYRRERQYVSLLYSKLKISVMNIESLLHNNTPSNSTISTSLTPQFSSTYTVKF